MTSSVYFKTHKFPLDGYITHCTKCTKKWCYMLPACAKDNDDIFCITCQPIYITKFNKHVHRGSKVNIPFWCKTDVTICFDYPMGNHQQHEKEGNAVCSKA